MTQALRSLTRGVLAAALSGFVGSGLAETPSFPPISAVLSDRVAAAIAARAARDEPVEALVLLDDRAERRDEELVVEKAGGRLAYAERIAVRIQQLDALKASVLDAVSDPDIEVLETYSVVPVVHLRLKSGEALSRLTANAKVVSVDENIANEATLSQSLALIGQPQVWSQGARGSNKTVAVLDTGVDYTRSAFGSCTAANVPAGTCRVVYAADFATNDNLLDEALGHGTSVAAIVLGVAPEARIAALDVFRPDGLAYSSDVVRAIDWVVANKAAYDIAAINLSMGSGRYYAPVQPTDSWGTAIQRAVDAGIAVVASSGNGTWSDSLSLPAAYTNVISVGAVYDSNLGQRAWSSCTDTSTRADLVTCFSNSASFLDLLAPGAVINAGGVTMSGTSQASPHAAGAAAILRAAFPSDTAAHLAVRLRQGPSVTDPRSGVVRPRLDLVDALDTAGDFVLATSAGEGGRINPAFGGVYAPGTRVTATATADPGYSFSGWSGDCSGTATQCALDMTRNRSISATFQVTPIALTNGTAVGGIAANSGSKRYYYIDVPNGASSLTIQSWGGSGDVDLFVRRGSLPTSSAWDCRPFVVGNDENCTLSNPLSGRYYIMLNAFSSFSGVSLQASYPVANAQLLQFGSSTHTITESGGTVTIPVSRTNGSTGAVSVQYATANSSALAGSDYTSRSGTLSFAAGVTSANVLVPILNNTIVEGTESFRVVLSNPVGAVLGARSATTVTILDDDSTVDFTSPIATTTETLRSITLYVRRIGSTQTAASVRYATANGSALAPSDYATRSGTLSWAAGDATTKTIVIPIVDDRVREQTENFSVVLSSPSGTMLGSNARAVITITDNDLWDVPPAQERFSGRSFSTLLRALGLQ